MRISRALSSLALLLIASLARAAGLSFIEVPADEAKPALRGAIWYPCAAPAGQVKLGPGLSLSGVQDCPVSGGPWPLIVVSHGSAGSFAGHHDTAEALADAGFVVAAISHPGDNFRDLSRQGQLSVFATRSMDMKRLVDFMRQRWPQREHLANGGVGFFGFSRGGTTGFIAAGARPNFRLGMPLCDEIPDIPMCGQIRRGEFPEEPPAHDARIKAAVIADPLSPFDANGLKDVRIPIQLWASELGGEGVRPADIEGLRRNLPVPPNYRQVPNAAHFAFLAPCSPAQAQAIPVICRDADNFDRHGFHKRFNSELIAFFRQHLAP